MDKKRNPQLRHFISSWKARFARILDAIWGVLVVVWGATAMPSIFKRIIVGAMRRVIKPAKENFVGLVLAALLASAYSAHLHHWSKQTLWNNIQESIVAPCFLALCVLFFKTAIQAGIEVYRQELRPIHNSFGETIKALPKGLGWQYCTSIILILVIPVISFCLVFKTYPEIFTSPLFVVDQPGHIQYPNPKSLFGLPAPETDHPPSLVELFEQEFPNDLKVQNNLKMKDSDLQLKEQVYLDFQGNSEFVGFYVPQDGLTQGNETVATICKAFAGQVQPMLKTLRKNLGFSGGFGIENMRNLDELTFTRVAQIYHENWLTITQKAGITEAFKEKDIGVEFRGVEHALACQEAWRKAHNKSEKN